MMTPYRVVLRQAPLTRHALTSRITVTRQSLRHSSSQGDPDPGRGVGRGRLVGAIAVAFAAAGLAVMLYPAYITEPAKPAQATISYEKPRSIPQSKEDNRDLISSQHIQVKKSWESPALYAWGSNTGRVASPDSAENVIKTPRRIPYFDRQLLRDVKLDREFGAALTEEGDLVQWGTAFSKTDPRPVKTLKGKDLSKLAISRDRILALAKDGTVYSIPVSGSDQASSPQTDSPSWLGLWSSPSSVSYRKLNVPSLSWGESVVDITSGLEHALLLTNRGRVFSAASSNSDFPSKGQLGVPGLVWETRPQGSYDQPHEISSLRGFNITKVAAGDYHSLALDKEGRAFVFGDNTSGQLGFEAEREIPFIDSPIPLPFNKIYSGSQQQPRVTSIAAGGANSFFTVDATKIAGQTGVSQNQNQEIAPARDLGRVTSDTWACGSGIFGSLGNGKWTHNSLGPSKIKPLSGLFEWDEKNNTVVPIRLARLSVGSTHAAAVMDNITYVDASPMSSDHDTNWGADIVWWGGNEHYQLGTGKRNNANSPIYIGPLDGGEGDALKGRKGEQHRFQITPRSLVQLGEGGKGRKVSVEQRVECGRFVSAVYSGT